MFERVRIVLVETSHPGNIGAAARAMKNMGFYRLVLVKPERFPCVEATARASGADDLLMYAEVYENLTEAISGCQLILGSSARPRHLAWPLLTPKTCAQKIGKTEGEVALVFGREHSGLTNQELEHCHAVVQIPTAPAFSSLNVAAAVQILCYELRCYGESHSAISPKLLDELQDKLVNAEQMQLFYQHLEQTLIDIEFLDSQKPKHLMRRLHRLFNRAQLRLSEYNILRGILTAAQTKVKKR